MKVKKKMAMLVIEDPMNCRECPLTDISSMSGDKLCLAAGGKWIENQNEQIPMGNEHRPEWCPLIAFEVEVEKKTMPYSNWFAKEVIDR